MPLPGPRNLRDRQNIRRTRGMIRAMGIFGRRYQRGTPRYARAQRYRNTVAQNYRGTSFVYTNQYTRNHAARTA